jgi:hypothetical protein
MDADGDENELQSSGEVLTKKASPWPPLPEMNPVHLWVRFSVVEQNAIRVDPASSDCSEMEHVDDPQQFSL